MLSGVAGVVGLVSFYAALAAGTMGVVSPIAALGVVVPCSSASPRASGRRPLQLVGIVVAVAGVVLASGPELSGRAGARPVLARRGRGGGLRVALLAIAEGSRHSTLMTLVTMRLTSVTLLAVALVVALGSRDAAAEFALTRATSGWWRWSASATSRANLSFGLASRRDDVSVVSVLGSLYPVVTVLLARGLHGERLGRLQSAGVAGALAGVVLIATG